MSIDTDAELAAKIENHRQSLEDARAEREGTKTKLSDEQDSMAAYERKRSQAQTSHGRLQALKQVRFQYCCLFARLDLTPHPFVAPS